MTPSIRRLLVPIDFSTGSDRASQYAAVLATALGASVHLLHVLEESFATHAVWEGDALDVSARRERAVRESEARLSAIAAGFARTGARVTIEVRSGPAAREILAVAERRGTDLVVMGTHGRTGLRHLLHGSVAEHVVRKAPCPVLAVCESGVTNITRTSAAVAAYAL
jgi:universal stress protein A